MKTTIKVVSDPKDAKEMFRLVERELQSSAPRVIESALLTQLKSQKNEDGTAFPTKAPGTIKQYQKHGWNTKDYLIRTGESTSLTSKNIKGGVVVEPTGQDLLKKFESKANFVYASPEMEKKIEDMINKITETI
jgi:hypothetical protein